MKYEDYHESTHRYRSTRAQIDVGAAAGAAGAVADRTYQRC